MMSLVQQMQTYLRETTLVVKYPQYPMRLSGDEVKAGLVVAEGLLLPLDLLPHILLLHTQHKSSDPAYETLLTSLFVFFSALTLVEVLLFPLQFVRNFDKIISLLKLL